MLLRGINYPLGLVQTSTTICYIVAIDRTQHLVLPPCCTITFLFKNDVKSVVILPREIFLPDLMLSRTTRHSLVVI